MDHPPGRSSAAGTGGGAGWGSPGQRADPAGGGAPAGASGAGPRWRYAHPGCGWRGGGFWPSREIPLQASRNDVAGLLPPERPWKETLKRGSGGEKRLSRNFWVRLASGDFSEDFPEVAAAATEPGQHEVGLQACCRPSTGAGRHLIALSHRLLHLAGQPGGLAAALGSHHPKLGGLVLLFCQGFLHLSTSPHLGGCGPGSLPPPLLGGFRKPFLIYGTVNGIGIGFRSYDPQFFV